MPTGRIAMSIEKQRIWLIAMLFACFFVTGCKIDWFGSDEDDLAVKEDELTVNTLATVTAVDGSSLQIQTDTDIIFDCSAPTGDVPAVGDTILAVINYLGSQDKNEWNLIDVTVQAKDLLEVTALATVLTVDGDELVIETDTETILDVTKPSEETVAVDDTVQVIITFEGYPAVNVWNLIETVFDQVVI
jgi:hypothetical protein